MKQHLNLGPIVTSSCVNTVQNPSNFGSGSTIIKSPKYPQPYPNNIECFWNISVPCQGTVPTSNLPGIKITFDKFLLKSNEDILEIKMGNWLVHSIRGKEQPQPMFFREQYVEYELLLFCYFNLELLNQILNHIVALK